MITRSSWTYCCKQRLQHWSSSSCFMHIHAQCPGSVQGRLTLMERRSSMAMFFWLPKSPTWGCGFGIKPKIHLFKHMLYSYKLLLLSGCERFVRLLLFNCEQNEDLIGRMSRLSRRLDSRQVSRRCLECYGTCWRQECCGPALCEPMVFDNL